MAPHLHLARQNFADLTQQPAAEPTPQPLQLAPGEFAILANANARGFQSAWRRGAFTGLRQEDIFVSHQATESEGMLRTALQHGYKALFFCGGDGTITHFLNDLRAALPNPIHQPYVGVIRLGTGNAVADTLRCGRAVDDLARLQDLTATAITPLPLLETEGLLCPFAGCGVDAQILNEYIALREKLAGTPLHKVVTGVRGYLVTGIFKTAPMMAATRTQQRVIAINEGATAYAVDKNGRILEHFRRGDVLYDGPMLMAAAGTIPYYGYRLRMFPAARLQADHFQLRIGMMNPLMAVYRLRRMWRGDLDQAQGAFDFLAQRVRLEFDAPMPFHIAGDAVGYRREVTFARCGRLFNFVRPLGASVLPLASTRLRTAAAR